MPTEELESVHSQNLFKKFYYKYPNTKTIPGTNLHDLNSEVQLWSTCGFLLITDSKREKKKKKIYPDFSLTSSFMYSSNAKAEVAPPFIFFPAPLKTPTPSKQMQADHVSVMRIVSYICIAAASWTSLAYHPNCIG